jgi:hypothetical protein
VYIATRRDHKTYDLLAENDRQLRRYKFATMYFKICATYTAGKNL